MLSAFKFICGESDRVCRLCFASTENEEVSFHDTVTLSKSYFDDTVTFVEMLDDLGVHISKEPFLPRVLCMECAKTTISGYLFQKLCHYSAEKWNEAFESMTRTLDQAEEISPHIKSAYIMINKTDSVIYTSKKVSKGKISAVNKIKNILSNRTKFRQNKKIKSIACQVCGEKFSTKILLKKHRRIHGFNDENTFVPCPQCIKMFPTRLQLTDHMERVHYPKNIQCTKCAKMFSTEKMLKRHDKLHHIAAICKLCFKQCPSKNALRAHSEQHGIKRCEQCNKNFCNTHTYKLHLKICGNANSKQPVYFCDICNKGYARKNSLRTHLKIDHGFGQVMSCPWCSKKFDAKSRLQNHIVKHTKEKNFYCDQCGGKFVTQAALVYHIRLHTGERPYPCDLCDESFLSASRRMEHKRRKHLAPTKECPLCHMKFVTTYQLKKHEERHYNPQSKLYVPSIETY